MKFLIYGLLFTLSGSVFAQVEPSRPNDRFFFIGSFTTSNPFKWDTDTIRSNVRARSSAVVFELEGGVDVEIGDVTVICRGGQVCARVRGVDVTERRPVRLWFRRDIRVEAITVRARPNGVSVPSPKVNVYLQAADNW